MNLLTKLTRGALAIFVPVVMVFASLGQAAADSGQIQTGLKVADQTTGTTFANPASANACDALVYKSLVWNPGPGTVSNVMAQVSIPGSDTTSNTTTISFSASNAAPSTVSAQVTVNLSSAQTLSYVSNSAELLDSNNNLVEMLPDSIFNYQAGANIGTLNPSQLEYIQFNVNVGCPTPPPPPPAYSCDSLSVTAGDNRTVTVSALDTTAKNGATFTKADVNWGDNSSVLTAANVVGKTHQYAANGTYTIAATAHFNVNGQDKTATSQGCTQIINVTVFASPVYQCNAFSVTAGDNRTVTVSALDTTAKNGATFTKADVNWGDNSSVLTAANVVGKTHQYAANGTYTIAATAHFNVNGQDKTATGPSCEKVVTFSSTTPPTVTPPTPPATTTAAPTQLVNTGAGNTIGLFAAATAIGIAAYRFVISRRLSRQ